MRLTLRTLLAYLDDILEPTQTREIGKKVQEAPLAQELVTRIRDVVRKRRLMAPTLEGPESGLDPNIVAEYLDNQLTPPQVAQTERILLNSEMHLAEVASAHQILTLVLGEPVEVLPDSRSRMYALGPVADADKLIVEWNETAAPTIEPTDRLAVPAPNGSAAPTTTDAGVSLAGYVNERAKKRSRWPLVGVGLLAALFIALQWTDPGKADPAESNSKELVADAGAGSPAVVPDADIDATGAGESVAAAPSTDTEPATEEPAAAGPDVAATTEPVTTPDPVAVAADPSKQPTEEPIEPIVAATATQPMTIDQAPPADEPEITTPVPTDTTPIPGEPTVVTTEPADTADVPVAGVEPTETPDVTFVAPPGVPAAEPTEKIAMPAPPTEPEPVPDDPGKDIPPAPVGGRLQYASTSGALLRQSVQAGWKLVQRDEEIGDGDRIACPKPYTASLSVQDQPIRIYLPGGGRMSSFNSELADVGIHLERGHVVFEGTAASADEAEKKSVTIELAVADRSWIVTIGSFDAQVAFEATPVPPLRLDTVTDGFPFKIRGLGRKGIATITDDNGDAKTLGPEDRVTLARPTAGSVLVEPGGASDWIAEDDPIAGWLAGPTVPTDKRDAKLFFDEFDPTDAVAETMPSLIKHERAWMARRAVQCLALTDQYRSLVRALSIAEHDDATSEAILGLRTWLPSDPANGEMLTAALEQEFTAGDSLAIYELLWGYDETHARDPKTCRTLVDYLGHKRPIIQRLAYFQIIRLTGTHDDFKPSISESALKTFRKRWERQIDRNKTLLPN